MKIGETTESIEIIREERKEVGKTVYSGMFITGGTMEDERKSLAMKSKVETEDDLYKVCGSRDLRKFKQDGKNARYVLG